MKKITFWGMIIFACSLFFTACSKQEKALLTDIDNAELESGDPRSIEEEYYVETAEALGIENGILIPSEEGTINKTADPSYFFFYKGNVFFLFSEIVDDEEISFLSCFESETNEVKCQRLVADFAFSVDRCKVLPNGELYLLICDANDEQWISEVRDKVVKPLFKIEGSYDCTDFYGDGNNTFWLYDSHSSVVRQTDSLGNIQSEICKQDKVCGIFYDDTNANVVFLENRNGQALLDSNGIVNENPSINTKIIPYGALMDYSSDGKAFICQSDYVYANWDRIFDFTTNDCIISHVFDFRISDAGFELIATIDGYVYYINVEEGKQKSEKKEIVLATGFVKQNLLKAAANFNRSNSEYHVTIYQMEDIIYSVSDSYFGSIHQQIAEGKGPDIVTNDVVSDLSVFVKSGYLIPIEIDINEEDFVSGVFDTLIYRNELYGIPYDFQLKTVVSNAPAFEENYSGDEFMNRVRNSGAEILQCGETGINIVLDYFLYDTTKTDYIDWEKGVSHLNEKAFVDVLKFSKDYCDKEDLDGETPPYEADFIKQGKALFYQIEIIDIYSDVNFIKALFGNNYFYAGYSDKNGGGSVIEPSSMYISAFSKEQEGAIEFIKYCISSEYQDMIAEWMPPEKGYFGIRPKLPVLKNSLSYMFEIKRHSVDEIYYSNPNGAKYKAYDLDDRDINLLYDAIDTGAGMQSIPEEVREMIIEELSYYFDGARSAEEVTKKLDRRLTVYLNEKR